MRGEVDGDVLAGLVEAARAGDRPALEELLRRLRGPLLRYCTARLGSRERGEDVTQEVCLALVHALPRYEQRGLAFTAFAFRIAQRRIIDSYRSEARRPLHLVAEIPEILDEGDGPQEHVERVERIGVARELLARLPDAQRDVVLLRVTGGLSAQETAEVLGSTPGAVRVMQHRALTRLRQLAAEHAGAQT